MQLAVVGTGYVGLVTAACFAEMGYRVACHDINSERVHALQRGEVPFFEPQLPELVLRGLATQRLSFTCDLKEVLTNVSACFLAVPTPSLPDGSCDLSYLLQASTQIAEQLETSCVVVIKSTAAIGTGQKIQQKICEILQRRGVSFSCDVVSNPEFLKEGSAVQDCMKPERIVLGVQAGRGLELLRKIYAPFMLNHDRLMIMDIPSAEMTKYAANAMLASRVSFMNELSWICEKVGANIHDVRKGIGSDRRIGDQFLYAGIGFGGSCFPKDLRALRATGKQVACQTPLLDAVLSINQTQQENFIEKIRAHFEREGGLESKVIALWGLSFKPDTDDLREAPSLRILEGLLGARALLRLYDPVALPKLRHLFDAHPALCYCHSEYEAAEGADAIVLITEWKQFRSADLHRVKQGMRGNAFFDGRNQYHREQMQNIGFDYTGIGLS